MNLNQFGRTIIQLLQSSFIRLPHTEHPNNHSSVHPCSPLSLECILFWEYCYQECVSLHMQSSMLDCRKSWLWVCIFTNLEFISTGSNTFVSTHMRRCRGEFQTPVSIATVYSSNTSLCWPPTSIFHTVAFGSHSLPHTHCGGLAAD